MIKVYKNSKKNKALFCVKSRKIGKVSIVPYDGLLVGRYTGK